MDENKAGDFMNSVFQDYYSDNQSNTIRMKKTLRALFAINKVGKINFWVRANIKYSNSSFRPFQLIGRMCHNHILKWYSSEISPYSKIGKNVCFPHPIGIVIGNGVVLEDNVTVYQNVTIGKTCDEAEKYPVIGHGVTIYTGATIIGDVKIEENCVIGAHAVVTKSTEAGHIYAGVPAKKIK